MTSKAELLEVLEEYLRADVQGELTGMAAYQNRIAANLVAILRREQALGPQLRALDDEFALAQGLAAAEMPQVLARALRDGRISDGPPLRKYLRLRSLLVLATDNPRYSGLAQARERWPEARKLEIP